MLSGVHNLMLQDVLGSLIATLAFALVLYAPGYVLAHAANLFSFRQMTFADRSIWAIACSFLVMPATAYFLGKSVGLTGICWALAASAIVTAWLIWRRSAVWPRSDIRITALLAGGWIAFVLLMLVDAQIHQKLYFSVVMADQSYRIAFTDAVVRTGIPPANPLYFAGATAPMRYYYFWYVLCAAVVKIAHVSARQAFIASSVWAGFGLLVTVKLYGTHFFHWKRKTRWLALALLAVTGADLLPSLGNAVLQPTLNGDIEWWSVDPIDAWPDSLLWVPHHTASVICCLLAFLLLWRTLEPLSRNTKHWAVALTAVAFAGASGLSVYVAFGFALLMLAWMLRLAVVHHLERKALWLRVATAGLLSALLVTPFVLELLHGQPHAATSTEHITPQPATALFTLSVRRMIDSGLLTGMPVFAAWNHAHPALLDQSIRLLLLLPGLAMELGLYGAVLVLLLRARQRHMLPPDAARDTALFFTTSGLLMTLFLSSSVITNNDFGYRAVMLPQFFLLLLTADLLGSWQTSEGAWIPPTRATRGLLYSLLTLGIAGSLYGAFLLRAWLPIETHHKELGFNELPSDAFQIREAFATLDRAAPLNAVVALRSVDLTLDRIPDEVMTPGDFYQRIQVMDAGRQMLNAEDKCATHFGGDPAPCSVIKAATTQLYAQPAPDAAWARSFCSRFGVQYLALGPHDPSWGSTTGWPASLPIIAAQPRFRILHCAN